MKKLIYFLWTKFVILVGDLKFFGWTHPFWFVFNAPGYRLRGSHYREVSRIIIPGDVLLSRSEQYVDTYLIPGWWTHAGLFFGGDKELVIHATSEGVLIEDIINFMRTDYLIVLRPDKKYVDRALGLAKNMIGKEYDFLFNFDDKTRLSCTEVVYCCYHQLIKPKRKMGKFIVVADDIVNSENFSVIWDSRNSLAN